MRLIHTDRIELQHFDDDEIPEYAILSHRWEEEEVLFEDMKLGTAPSKKGYEKLQSCCRVARANGFDYLWDDTCCIDKTSSAELSEAINSMYRWYQEAPICYAYLADVSANTPSEFSDSRWFTRGWTLQELIAPSTMIFFDKHWREIGTKTSLVRSISDRTGIPESILLDAEQLEAASIAQRMSWAADRVTTRKEDRAYSLMGIFGINMPLLYGEGDKAFYRLQDEIMRVSEDHSLFAWRHPDDLGGFLAPTPAAFKDSGNIIPWNPFTPYNKPFTATNKGVHINAPFIGQDEYGRGLVVLNCTVVGSKNQLIAVWLRDMFLTMEYFERCKTREFHLINLDRLEPTRSPTRDLYIRLQGRVKRYGPRAGSRTLAAPFSYAARPPPGRDRPVNLLLDEDEDDYNYKGYYAMAVAGAAGDEGTVWLVLARDAEFQLPEYIHEARATMCLAVRGGHERLVSQLLARKDTEWLLTDGDGRTVLSHAAEQRDEAMVRLILASRRVSPNDARIPTHLPLYCAAQYHDGPSMAGCGNDKPTLRAYSETQRAIIEMLVYHGADTRGPLAEPLEVACAEGNLPDVEFLLKHGASTERRFNDPAGGTLLIVAARAGNVPIVKLLLEHGADWTAKDSNNRTAVFYATDREIKSLLGNPEEQEWYRALWNA